MARGVNNFRCDHVDLLKLEAMEDYIYDGKFELITRSHYETDAGETETNHKVEAMLAILLIAEVVFINTPWYRDDLKEEDKKYLHKILVNSSDVFIWGCADAEEISMSEIPELYDMWIKDHGWGPAVWCIKKCNYMPQKPVYDRIQREGIWNLDEMGLRPNSSWGK